MNGQVKHNCILHLLHRIDNIFCLKWMKVNSVHGVSNLPAFGMNGQHGRFRCPGVFLQVRTNNNGNMKKLLRKLKVYAIYGFVCRNIYTEYLSVLLCYIYFIVSITLFFSFSVVYYLKCFIHSNFSL